MAMTAQSTVNSMDSVDSHMLVGCSTGKHGGQAKVGVRACAVAPHLDSFCLPFFPSLHHGSVPAAHWLRRRAPDASLATVRAI